jgi:hypothetical protein
MPFKLRYTVYMSLPSITFRLFTAIQSKDMPEVVEAIASGADLHSEETVSPFTPLELAIVSGFAPAVEALLQSGCIIRNMI